MNRIVSLVAVRFLIACSHPSNVDDSERSTKIDGTVPGIFTIQNGQAVRVRTSTGNVAIQVASVIESRCPSDLICVWQGKVDVAFQFGDKEKRILLCLPEQTLNCQQEAEISYQNKEYKLKLIKVEPYPTTTDESEPKVVTFELRLK